jgi:type II restriction enzyme
MTREDIIARVDKLAAALRELTRPQLEFIESVVDQFRRPFITIERHPESDLVDDRLLRDFGDVLRIHHCFSKESLSKDRFEYAFERILNQCGKRAVLAPKGNPGHDITIEDVPCSLKTQADANIKEDKLHISKFMELGKGHWSARVKDLDGLRDQFFEHMTAYERIFSLRCLSKDPARWHYELVEIPKALLEEARGGKLSIRRQSTQSPKPGYCDVKEPRGELKYQLYFDGGTERKLQIKNLRKDLCTVHGTWIFATEPEEATEQALGEPG